mmetsp:Transcript_33791/g.107303  ORF Transcript_33791/g.107303 Transcript_33791/m.107303 type:complete len:375 (-) Transcript_33791:456-1580(-)
MLSGSRSSRSTSTTWLCSPPSPGATSLSTSRLNMACSVWCRRKDRRGVGSHCRHEMSTSMPLSWDASSPPSSTRVSTSKSPLFITDENTEARVCATDGPPTCRCLASVQSSCRNATRSRPSGLPGSWALSSRKSSGMKCGSACSAITTSTLLKDEARERPKGGLIQDPRQDHILEVPDAVRLMDAGEHEGVRDGHDLLENHAVPEEGAVGLPLRQLGVVLQRAHHVHHVLLAQQHVQDGRVVEQHDAPHHAVHVRQPLGVLHVLDRAEELQERGDEARAQHLQRQLVPLEGRALHHHLGDLRDVAHLRCRDLRHRHDAVLPPLALAALPQGVLILVHKLAPRCHLRRSRARVVLGLHGPYLLPDIVATQLLLEA